MAASIHLGASSISMLIMSVSENGKLQPVEFLEQPIPLGRNIFQEGKVSHATLERCVEILRGYREALKELNVPSERILRVVATNILSEASNTDVVLNRLQVGAGLQLEILDDGEMTRLIYLKTKRRLREIGKENTGKGLTLVVHVGPGNTRALLFSNGRIEHYASYRLGTHRAGEAIDASHVEGPALLRLINEHTTGPVGHLSYDLRNYRIDHFVAIGYELQHLAPFLNNGDDDRVSLKFLQEQAEKAALMSPEERIRNYQLDYHSGAALLPSLGINIAIAKSLKLRFLHIPQSDYEQGLLHDLPASGTLPNHFREEVRRSARALGGKYGINNAHANQVAKLCKKLFEQTSSLHNLDTSDELLLEIAALLHECGGYISPHAHHKHSEYVIRNSEIFGVNDKERILISLIARYHRMSGPKMTHSTYRDLPTKERMRVTKLAAILRVADALERTHSQRVKDLTVTISSNRLCIRLHGINDAIVERLAMQGKGDLFTDIFGLKVILQEGA